jgi:threonine/homoserine/homoserine lactone efflux protein
MDAWIPFMLFSVVMAVTPGPTNILVFAISSRHGWVAALPAVLGAGAGVATLLLLAGLGLSELLLRLPQLQSALAWAGAAWLSWLAWKIFSTPPPAVTADAAENAKVQLGFVGTVGLQLVNPKAWIMALTAVTVFAGAALGRAQHTVEMALLFYLLSLPCVGVWAALGAGTGRMIRSPRHMAYLNRTLAVLLLVSAWTAVLV